MLQALPLQLAQHTLQQRQYMAVARWQL
jgi:hypothetical protein